MNTAKALILAVSPQSVEAAIKTPRSGMPGLIHRKGLCARGRTVTWSGVGRDRPLPTGRWSGRRPYERSPTSGVPARAGAKAFLREARRLATWNRPGARYERCCERVGNSKGAGPGKPAMVRTQRWNGETETGTEETAASPCSIRFCLTRSRTWRGGT